MDQLLRARTQQVVGQWDPAAADQAAEVHACLEAAVIMTLQAGSGLMTCCARGSSRWRGSGTPPLRSRPRRCMHALKLQSS